VGFLSAGYIALAVGLIMGVYYEYITLGDTYLRTIRFGFTHLLFFALDSLSDAALGDGIEVYVWARTYF
jgi:hypothetical protein